MPDIAHVKQQNCRNQIVQFTTSKCAMKRCILNIALLYSICNTQFKDMSSYYPDSNETINQKDKTSPTKL